MVEKSEKRRYIPMVETPVRLYSDGACKGNPGVGGYGTILVYKGREKEISEGFAETTNNRMELLGAIAGLEALRRPCRVVLTSDSKYLVDGMVNGWAAKWKESGWKKSDGKPALNVDLWERLLDLCAIHEVSFEWIKGHDGHPYNERCDKLAVAAAKRASEEKKAREDDSEPGKTMAREDAPEERKPFWKRPEPDGKTKDPSFPAKPEKKTEN